MKKMKKLHVDQDKCVSCGACIAECALLQENDEGKAVPVSGGVITIETEQSVMNAVENCPVNALQIKDESRTLEQIIEELNKPLEIPEIPTSAYQFNKENYYLPVMSGRGEYQYNYSSDDKAEREGLRDFRDNIYSQKKAIAQQVIASYKQEKLVPLMKYEEQAGNYLYETNKQLEEKLRSYAAEIEACLGKKFNKSLDFFRFATRHNKVIGWSTDYLDESLASSVANACESYDWFDCYVNSDDMIVGTKSYWYMDGDVDVYKYCYRLDEASEKLNQQILDECQSIVSERAKKQIESAMQFYYQDLDKEWREKVKIVKDVDNYIGSELDKCGNEVVAPIKSRNSVGDISENYHGGNLGYDKDGYDRNGRDVEGYNRQGFSQSGVHRNGTLYDANGFDMGGFDKYGYDKNGYDKDGYNKSGYNRELFNRDGLYINGEKYDVNGYDKDGYNRNGFNCWGRHFNGTNYDEEGYNKQGYDWKGYDRKGYDRKGFDPKGRHRNGTIYDDNGFDIDGYDRQGYDKERINRKGYHISGRRVRK